MEAEGDVGRYKKMQPARPTIDEKSFETKDRAVLGVSGEKWGIS